MRTVNAPIATAIGVSAATFVIAHRSIRLAERPHHRECRVRFVRRSLQQLTIRFDRRVIARCTKVRRQHIACFGHGRRLVVFFVFVVFVFVFVFVFEDACHARS